MPKEPRGLGKGLSALLGDAGEQADQLRKPVGYVNKEIAGRTLPRQGSDVCRISINNISPNPYQPRMSFDQEALEELAQSIRTLGLIQPISVRRISEDNYQIISGERRFKACSLAGMTMIPAYILNADNQAMLEMAIVENIQRRDLDPVEEALSYRRLIDECSMTQEQMALRLGLKRSSIANTLRLLNLPVKVQHDLKVGLLSVGHAKVILGVDDPALQEKICDIVIADGLNVRQLEALVRKVKVGDSVPRRPAKKALTEEYERLADCLGKYFTGGITMRRSSSGRGSMTVTFSSDREVGAFLELLSKMD